jgi:4-azaleucine resistance transporter AzlC
MGRSPLLLSVPVAVGYVPLGAVFGFLFVQAGGAWWMAIASSVLIYAGASQFMMIPMLTAGLPIGSIALATLVVNLRHVFYGLSLLHLVPKNGLAKFYLIFGLTDETYSLITTLPAETTPMQRVWLTLINQMWWVSGTALGAVLGSQMQNQLAGLDFALVALFAVLVVEQWRARSSAKPLWVALLSYPVAWLMWPANALLAAIGMSVVAAIWLDWITHGR